jgi:hypothetical protein
MELEGIMTSSISILAPSLEHRVAGCLVWLRLAAAPAPKGAIPKTTIKKSFTSGAVGGVGALFHEGRGATDRGFSRLRLTIAEAKTLLPSAFSLLGYEATPA